MLKYVPVSLGSLRSLPKTPLVVTFLFVFFSSFLIPALRLVSFLMLTSLFGGVCLTWGQVRSPPIGGPLL